MSTPEANVPQNSGYCWSPGISLFGLFAFFKAFIIVGHYIITS